MFNDLAPPRRRPILTKGEVIGVAALLAACSAAWLLGRYRAQHTPTPRAGLVASPDRLDLGDIWESNEVLHTLPVRNTTDRAIEVLEFRSSCNCVSVDPKAVTVPAGQQVELHLKLSVLTAGASKPDPVCRDLEISVLPIVRGGFFSQQEWRLHGKLRRSLQFDRTVVQFAAPLVQGWPFQTETVRVSALLPVRDLHVRYDRRQVSAKLTRVAGGSSDFDLSITPLSTLPRGRFRAALSVAAVPAEGPELPPRTLLVSGLICDNIESVPSETRFGPRQLGEVVSQVVLLHACHPEEFQVESVDTPSTDVAVTPCPGAAPSSPRFLLRQRIARPGEHSSTVLFTVRRGHNGHTTTRLCITYYGLGTRSPKSAREQ
jgi:hypothetical protein